MALGHVPGGRQNDAVERQYTPRLLRWIRLKRGRTSDEEAVLYKLTECHIRDHMRHKDFAKQLACGTDAMHSVPWRSSKDCRPRPRSKAVFMDVVRIAFLGRPSGLAETEESDWGFHSDSAHANVQHADRDRNHRLGFGSP